MLYVVPTPIGNLGDITLRAIEVLRSADVIACEDTRTSSKLLNHYGIETPRISYHEHNERSRTSALIERLMAGDTVAIITDAGMPGISDPGFYLVRECVRNDIAVTILPGASAGVTALVGSGIPCDRYVFEGFLPTKKGRQTRIASLHDERRTIVLFESPHRILRTLRELADALGPDRKAAVGREISKRHEEYIRGTLEEILSNLESRDKPRGEFVIVLEGQQ